MPTKAVYKAFESDGNSEFEFFLATELGGMTVAEMRDRMTAYEFLQWTIYFGRKAQRQQLAQRR